ncbi:MAG: hypothetical protein H0W11_12280, partial [Gemmatimonadetes bacterium]|nr:hypothetical protein [Gemmatimonadota bacterium]
TTPATRRAPRRAQPRPRLWSADLTLTGIYDTNATRSEDELDSQGVVVGGVARYQNHARQPTLQLRYAGAFHRYTGIDRWDRVSHSLRAAHLLRISPDWTLETAAIGSVGILTTEFRLADQVTLLPRLEYSPGRTHRIRGYGAVRQRWYRDEDRTGAFAPYIGTDYRYRWGSWHYWDTDVRYETIRAEVERRSLDRTTVSTAYTRPLGRNDRLRAGVAYRTWRYAARQVEVDGVEVPRQESRWTPSVLWIHDLWRDLRLDVEYRYDTRLSNQPGREFSGHRVAGTVRYRW